MSLTDFLSFLAAVLRCSGTKVIEGALALEKKNTPWSLNPCHKCSRVLSMTENSCQFRFFLLTASDLGIKFNISNFGRFGKNLRF